MQLSKLALFRGDLTRLLGNAAMQSQTIRAWVGQGRREPVEGLCLDEHLAAMLALDARLSASDLSRKTPEQARLQLAESVRAVEERIDVSLLVRDLHVKGAAGAIRARSYARPGMPKPAKAIMYIHGGGFVVGDLDTHDSFCRRLALDADARVISIDYRLAPEARFPAAPNDVVAAFEDLVARADELGIDAKKIAVMGDSAGGNLSAVVALRTRNHAIRPALQVLVYPALDATCAERSHQQLGEGYMLTTRMLDWYYNHYLGTDPAIRKHPDVSPLFAESVEGLPPAILYTAGFDPLRDEAIRYRERLQKAGVPTSYFCFNSMIHGFAIMGGLIPDAKEAAARICREVGHALESGTVS